MAVKVFFSYILNVRDTLSTMTTSDVFLKELLGIWAEVNFEPEIMSREHFLDQQLWHNSPIKIANKTVFFLKLVYKGNNSGETTVRIRQHFSFIK